MTTKVAQYHKGKTGLLTIREEKFCSFIACGEYKTNKEAYLAAGFKDYSGADAYCSLLIHKPEVIARIKKIRDKMLEPRIMSVIERKVVLSDVGREDIKTPDGTPIRGPKIQAISELNKMEKIYSETTVTQDNRKVINIFVGTERAKELTERMTERLLKEGVSEPSGN